MLERGNLPRALQAVERNAGAAGVDGLETSQLRRYLWEHWDRIKEQILKGSYEPRPVGGWWDTCVFSYHLHQSVKSAVQF